MEELKISEKALYNMIKDFYSDENTKTISVERDLRIEDDDLRLNLYLIKNGAKYIVTQEDLEYIFKFYLHSVGLEYHNFKFIGNIRTVGYFTNEYIPLFEGAVLYYLDRSKERKLVL